jgi:predicted acylesterase/phospholipase RssA/CRP-like cAMP-binding protein
MNIGSRLGDQLNMTQAYVDVEPVAAWLATARFCAGLDAEAIHAIAGQVEVRPFAAGQILASPGDAVTEFWIVAEGEIDAFLVDARGREQCLGIVRQGETVGELAILENTPTRPIRYSARTRGTLLLAPAAKLRAWIETYPVVMQNMFAMLSDRFKAVTGVASRKLPSPRLGIVVKSSLGYLLAGRVASRLIAAGERLRVWADDPSLLKSPGSWPEQLPVHELAANDTPLLEPPSPEVDRQLVVWSDRSDDRTEAKARQVLGCDEVLWMLEPRDMTGGAQDLRSLDSLRAELERKLRIVWLLDPGTPVAPVPSGWKHAKADLRVPIQSKSNTLSRLEIQGLDRVVRALRGYSIGLALAGGGAKGMAHLGVLRVLEQAGLSFDVMSGTSAGAMFGILYSAGMVPEQAVGNILRDLKPSRLVRSLPNWPNWYLLTQYRRHAWARMLRRYLHDWRLEQLPIPFYAITVDLVQAGTVVRSQGDAVHAILESINLPIVSKPILSDGMALVDGGVLNNLPADVLAESGVDFVVGVDVSRHVRQEFAGNRPGMPTAKMHNASALDTLFRIFDAQAHHLGNFRNRAVDFWIKPDVSGFGLAEFHRGAEIAAAGEAAAREKIPELKRCLADFEERLLEHPRQPC